MSGGSATDLLSVPGKRASDIDVTKALKTLITSTFAASQSSSAALKDVDGTLKELQRLRGLALIKGGEKGEAPFNAVATYYDQLASLEQKIPAHEVQIPFKWRDAFDRGSLFGGKISLTISSLSYEKACVLFNVAAMASAHAAEQNFDTPEGLQKALKRLQLAAGIFQYLKDSVVGLIQQDPTPDLEPDTLNVLSDLMLAQAQEMSKVCNANKTIGEEIARLEHAKSSFNAGLSRGGNPEMCHCKDWLKRTETALTAARKDNDFIYHERIPDTKSLEPVGKALVAKATLPLPSPIGPPSKDLFEELCPVAVHQALSAYEGRKQDIINTEVTKLKDGTQSMNQLLASMNLPAAVEDSSGSELPQSLKDKARAVQEAGGMDMLNKLIRELPELLTRNTEILDECERLLKEERSSDDQLRSQFKEKWTRTPSEKLTTTFMTNAQKYRTIINNAKQADNVVHDKLEVHKKGVEMLAKGPNNLQSVIPSGGGQNVKGSPNVVKLKGLMEDIETLKAERQVIESELKAPKIDMKTVFFNALNKLGVISEQELSLESLNRVYGPLQKLVTDNVRRQETLMAQIQETHEKFVKERGGQGSGDDRETMLKQCAAAHDAFFELKSNLQEGTKFYNDLTQLLVTFQSKVSDFCFARKTEKEELMKDLTTGMANMSMGGGPTPPSHHSNTPERPARKNDPPARPPPPVVQTIEPTPTAASAPPTETSPMPAAGGVSPSPNPYAGAPPGYVPPYPQANAHPGMPMAYQTFTPMPNGYNPYAGYPTPGAAYPPPAYHHPQYPYPPQYPPQGYPGQHQPPPPQ
ncbi:hypothetical protein TCAL_03284 [Tigriopus californicus]|uniref:BRO1 domain-containing protein n=1 Tax=Tigriopus californicus TaxID=6832 RepID=A0A553NR40_TIGCA|nr:hypothetical protein TCAL_03284 [Tigriopus californicus]